MKYAAIMAISLVLFASTSIKSYADESSAESLPTAAPANTPKAEIVPVPNSTPTDEDSLDYKKLNQNGINKKFKTLGFKGLHLGMTRDEVKELVKPENGWHLKYSHLDIGSEEYIFLTTNFPIGCEGEGETENCYMIESVSIEFFQDKVHKISLDGEMYSATDIEYYVKGWAKFALKALKSKYGKPTKTNEQINKVAAVFINSGYSRRINEWNKNGESIYLSIGCSEFKYYSSIKLVNTAVEAKIKNDKKKMKSEL